MPPPLTVPALLLTVPAAVLEPAVLVLPAPPTLGLSTDEARVSLQPAVA